MLVCLVLIAPLLWLLLLGLLWAAPLRASSQRSLLRAAERCFAWAALDVFVLTTLHPNPNPNPHPHPHPRPHPHPHPHPHPNLHPHPNPNPNPSPHPNPNQVLTLLAGLSQLPQYAQFMLGGECDGVDALLAAHFAVLLPGAPTCFGVATRLRAGGSTCSMLI